MRMNKKSLVNFSVFSYFLFMLLTTQSSNYIFFVGFYASLLLCGMVGIYVDRSRAVIKLIAIMCVFCFFGVVNCLFVGNTTLKDIIYMIAFSLAALALMSEYLEERTLLLILGINILVVLLRFATAGLHGQIYKGASSNFVSVYLMYPATIYYAVTARKSQAVNIIPVTCVWLISLLARGRGGILSTTFFMAGMLFIKYTRLKNIRKLVASLSLVVVGAFVMINLPMILRKLESSVIMEFFIKNGLRSSRTMFWAEYINRARSNYNNLLFGANLSGTFISEPLKGNPHNSFMEIHILNGAVPLLLVVLLIIKNSLKSIKTKNYVFLIAMLSMMIRAFTDHVLWAAFGTPVLWFFLLYYNTTKSPSKLESVIADN